MNTLHMQKQFCYYITFVFDTINPLWKCFFFVMVNCMHCLQNTENKYLCLFFSNWKIQYILNNNFLFHHVEYWLSYQAEPSSHILGGGFISTGLICERHFIYQLRIKKRVTLYSTAEVQNKNFSPNAVS